MIITTTALDAISTNAPLALQCDPPALSNPSIHPLLKSFSPLLHVRENQILVSQLVEGVVLVQNNSLTVIYFPKKTHDLVHDPTESDPILIGAVGTSLTSATPISVPIKSLFQDFLFLNDSISNAADIQFPHSTIFPKTCFANHPDKHPQALPFLSEKDVRCLRLPMVLPKLKGISLIEGSILDPSVLQAMQTYHPVAETWLKAHISISQNPATMPTQIDITSLDQNLLPNESSTIPLSPSCQLHLNILMANDNDPASLRAQITTVLKEKLSIHRASLPQPDQPSLTDTLSLDQPIPPTTTKQDKIMVGDRAIDVKHQRSINTWRLFLSGVGTDGNISLPSLTDAFIDGYTQSTITENTRLTSAAMREHDQRRSSDTRDYLHKLISDSQWNNTTTALFLNGVLFGSQLDEIVSYLQSSISFLTFLPIPPASVDPTVQTFLYQSNLEHLEAIVGESSEKKRKINLKTFQGGLQENPTHILTGLANFESKLSFMAEYSSTPESSQPLIVQWVNKLANVYSSRQFTRFYDKHHKALPWIPHTMVTQVQIIISSLAKISKSYLHHNVLKQQRNLHASILRTALKTFHDVMDDVKGSIRGSGLGCFATPPIIGYAGNPPTLKTKINSSFSTSPIIYPTPFEPKLIYQTGTQARLAHRDWPIQVAPIPPMPPNLQQIRANRLGVQSPQQLPSQPFCLPIRVQRPRSQSNL